jgi:hypothetical protein
MLNCSCCTDGYTLDLQEQKQAELRQSPQHHNIVHEVEGKRGRSLSPSRPIAESRSLSSSPDRVDTILDPPKMFVDRSIIDNIPKRIQPDLLLKLINKPRGYGESEYYQNLVVDNAVATEESPLVQELELLENLPSENVSVNLDDPEEAIDVKDIVADNTPRLA